MKKGIITVALAVLAFASFSFLFGWQFAIFLMAILFVHESGHAWGMKMAGVRCKGMYFLPFLGMVAMIEKEPNWRSKEAFLAIMGPVCGSALLLLSFPAYLVTQNSFFAATTIAIALLNLFQLVPFNPMDGGRIMKGVAFSLGKTFGMVYLIAGLLGAVLLAVTYHPIFLFVSYIGMDSVWIEYKIGHLRKPMSHIYIAAILTAYFLLAAGLLGILIYTGMASGIVNPVTAVKIF